MLDTLDTLDMLDTIDMLDMLDILRDASSSVLHDPNIYPIGTFSWIRYQFSRTLAV